MKKKKKMAALLLLCLITIWASCGCSRQSAYNNRRGTVSAETETVAAATGEQETNPNAVQKADSVYDCDIAADQAAYDGHVDITVGDTYYATQINDWYMQFDQYEGKVVQIEGYYLADFAPYDFIGRHGPSCPYCNGGYVSFEILAKDGLDGLQSAKDWIRVTGILRKGNDSRQGPFYYIEVLQLQKMDQPGMDTVVN